MGTASDLQALEAPGRLFYGVDNLAASEPFGGVELGLTRGAEWRRFDVRVRHTAQELQTRVVGSLFSSEGFALSFLLRGMDDDAISKRYPNTSAGAISQHRVIYGPGGVDGVGPGKLFEGAGETALLFLPDDVQNAPAALLRRSMFWPDEEAVPLSLGDELVIPTTFIALPGPGGRAYEIARFADLSGVGVSSDLLVSSATLAAYWDAEYGVTGTSQVTSWVDQVNGLELTASANHPSLEDSPTGFNGNPAILFSDDSGGDWVGGSVVPVPTVGAFSIFAVVRMDDASVFSGLCSFADAGVTEELSVRLEDTANGRNVEVLDHTSATSHTSSAAYTADTTHLVEAHNPGTVFEFEAGIDATVNDGTNFGGNWAPTQFRIGSEWNGTPRLMSGRIAALAIYQGALSSADRTTIRRVFRDRYAIAGLP